MTEAVTCRLVNPNDVAELLSMLTSHCVETFQETEPLLTGLCESNPEQNLVTLAYTASHMPYLKPKLRFSEPEIREFEGELSDNAKVLPLPRVIGEDCDDDEDFDLKKQSMYNKYKNTFCSKVNDHVLRESTTIISKRKVAEAKNKNYMSRNEPVKFVMGRLITSTTIENDMDLFTNEFLYMVRNMIHIVITQLKDGREVYPLYKNSISIKKVNIPLLFNRIQCINRYLKNQE